MIGSGFLQVWEHEGATICMLSRNLRLPSALTHWLRPAHGARMTTVQR
jgi:hypothetical protein